MSKKSFNTLSDDGSTYPEPGYLANILKTMQKERPDLEKKNKFKNEQAISYVKWVRIKEHLDSNNNNYNYNDKNYINYWLNEKYGRKPKPPSNKSNNPNFRERRFVRRSRGHGINKRRRTEARRRTKKSKKKKSY